MDPQRPQIELGFCWGLRYARVDSVLQLLLCHGSQPARLPTVIKITKFITQHNQLGELMIQYSTRKFTVIHHINSPPNMRKL